MIVYLTVMRERTRVRCVRERLTMRVSSPDEDAIVCIGTRDEEKLERSAPKGKEDLVQSTEVERRGIFFGVRFRVGLSLWLKWGSGPFSFLGVSWSDPGRLPQMVITWVRPWFGQVRKETIPCYNLIAAQVDIPNYNTFLHSLIRLFIPLDKYNFATWDCLTTMTAGLLS